MVNLLSVRVCLTRHGSSLESQMGWFWKYRSGFLLTFFARWIFGFVAKGDFKYSRSLGLRTNWKLSKAKRNRVKGDSKEILADISSKCNGKHWSYKRYSINGVDLFLFDILLITNPINFDTLISYSFFYLFIYFLLWNLITQVLFSSLFKIKQIISNNNFVPIFYFYNDCVSHRHEYLLVLS